MVVEMVCLARVKGAASSKSVARSRFSGLRVAVSLAGVGSMGIDLNCNRVGVPVTVILR